MNARLKQLKSREKELQEWLSSNYTKESSSLLLVKQTLEEIRKKIEEEEEESEV